MEEVRLTTTIDLDFDSVPGVRGAGSGPLASLTGTFHWHLSQYCLLADLVCLPQSVSHCFSALQLETVQARPHAFVLQTLASDEIVGAEMASRIFLTPLFSQTIRGERIHICFWCGSWSSHPQISVVQSATSRITSSTWQRASSLAWEQDVTGPFSEGKATRDKPCRTGRQKNT